jgi:lysozyme family protein
MIIRSNWMARAESAARKILAGKDHYVSVEGKTHVPWFLTGLIHLMEGDCNFRTHLHNGDSLSARTRHVPAGRPRTGNPPFAWEESAIDALAYDHIQPPLDTINRQFYALERFNGLGYRKKGIPTPYLWSGSNHYVKGKYVSDGKWDSNAVSEQVGAAVVLKVLKDKGHA